MYHQEGVELLLENDALVANGVTKQYGRFTAVDSVSFSVARGEIFGVLGPNGAGKTSLLECVVGMRECTAGSISVMGYDPFSQRLEMAGHVSIQPQHASLFDHLTVSETVELFASFYSSPLPVDQVIALMGLEEKSNVLVKRLSGGQKQRLLIAVAFVGNTDVLFLDEPTGSLDPQARRQLWDAIRARKDAGTTVIITTHSMEEAQALCDRVAIINKGRILAIGSPHGLVAEFLPDQLLVYETDSRPESGVLEKLPGVSSVLITPASGKYSVRIRTNQPDEVLRVMVSRHLLPSGRFRMESATLEDVFLMLVKRSEQGGGR